MAEKQISMCCQQCGKLFFFPASKRNARKFCSSACNYEAKKTPDSAARQTTICPICGKGFWYYPNEKRNTKTRYCSRDCANKGQTKKVAVECQVCKKVFYLRPSFVEQGRKFCSRKCYLKSIEKNKTRMCEYCGKQFEAQFAAQQKRYCSKECRFSARKGDKHPLWMGGVSKEPYPWTWGNELKSAIKNRDGYKCRECNGTTGLMVHHINYIKNDCRHDNLITLCNSCHSKTNFNRDAWLTHYRALVAYG